MKRMLLAALPMLACSFHLQAGELVYSPVNPAFGGSPLNGDWLIANAQAQNDHDDPDDVLRVELSPLDKFTDTLERLVLSRLATNAVEQFIVEGEFQAGSYTFNDFEIDIRDVDNILTIFVTDTSTGTTSEIEFDRAETVIR